MKNETLKRDLCARLMDGVKLKFVSTHEVDRLSEKDVVILKEIKEGSICINGYKTNNESYIPLLFPISALTKEIQLANYNNGEPFVPADEIGKIHLGDKYHSFDFPKEDENFIGFNSKYGGWSMYNFGDFSSLPQWIIELLNRWHINYRLSPDQFIEVTEEFNLYAPKGADYWYNIQHSNRDENNK